MNPHFPPSILIPLAVVVVALAVGGAWRGTLGLRRGFRFTLLGLRLLAVGGVLALLFNPGKWVNPTEIRRSSWVILADVSSSMAQPTADGKARADAAGALVEQARAHAAKRDLPLQVLPFSDKLDGPSTGPLPAPTGAASQIVPAVSHLLQQAGAAGEPLAGIVVLSDGRQTLTTSQAELDALGLRARSQNTAIHTVTLGADTEPPDLALIQPRAALTAFAGQPLRIPFALKSTGLAPIRPVVTLRDAAGKELAALTLEVAPGKTVAAVFELKAPAASAQWTIDTPVLPGEVRSANNRSGFNVRILDSQTRVFLVEGAPYWDSKFLAQLLRQQSHMEIQSVHRLSDQRYFRIDSGTNSETDQPVFPATLDELSRFDLIVFGKNVDPFLSPERAEMLRAYVRDRGGAVLFSRGKPTTGAVPGLEPLEPVVWGTATTADFRFAPNRDGEAAGLFGQALPAPDASLWASLPALKDGRQVALVKPFTRVLADGVPDLAGTPVASGKFPALLIRRYGQGVTGLVNGDGLWKWDFFPEARELGNCYEDFWTQLIQWMASYSEFLPGQDFSLRLPASRGDLGSSLAAAISYRGGSPVPQPTLRITSPSGAITSVSPAAIPDPSGRPLWRSSFTPDLPGTWTLKLVDPRPTAPPAPEVLFTVPTSPQEADDLSPDPALLESLARATGGVTLAPAGFTAFLNSRLVATPPTSRDSGAVWRSSWNTAFIAITIALLLAAEWFFRRRQGLA